MGLVAGDALIAAAGDSCAWAWPAHPRALLPMATAEPASSRGGCGALPSAGSARLDCAGSESHFLPRPEPAVAVKVAPRGRKRLALFILAAGSQTAPGRADRAFAELGWGVGRSRGRLRAETLRDPLEKGVRGKGGGRQVVEGQRLAEVGVQWGRHAAEGAVCSPGGAVEEGA